MQHSVQSMIRVYEESAKQRNISNPIVDTVVNYVPILYMSDYAVCGISVIGNYRAVRKECECKAYIHDRLGHIL